MALATLGVKYKSDKRDVYLHHGNWLVKLGLWLLFSVLPFFFPNGVISLYGGLSLRTPPPPGPQILSPTLHRGSQGQSGC